MPLNYIILFITPALCRIDAEQLLFDDRKIYNEMKNNNCNFFIQFISQEYEFLIFD